ncbi:MAG: HlyD family efflux transporter periplasmic adaptor subunit, partial [Thermodesulfovibrionales bacterium]
DCESMLGVIRVGSPVEVYVDALRTEYTTKVTEIIPSVDTKTRTFTAKIALPSKNIRSGMYAKVKILLDKREGILINKGWIVKKGQLNGVYTVDNKGLIHYRLIKIGKTFGDKIEVISGLSPKEIVISDGIQKAFEGGVIEVPLK